MQNLPQNVLREIARRVNMRNRMALEATSRTLHAAVRPVTAEITRETRAGLCRALKIAFGIRKVMHQFVDTVPSRVDPTKQIAFKKAIEAFISEAKSRAQPGEGAELTSRIFMDFYDTSCQIAGLFGGHVNGLRIDIEATIRPEFVKFNFLMRGWRGSSQAVCVSKAGVTSFARRRHSAAQLKKEIRRAMASRRGRRVLRAAEHTVLVAARRAAHEIILKELKMRLQQANYSRPETIATKVATRAIKACATSLHATMW
jgi:hypothetical protein